MRNDPYRRIPKSLELVADIAERGVDLGEDHAVEHFFVGAFENAEAVSALFDKGGYAVAEARKSKDDDIFGVVVNQKIDAETIKQSIIDACKYSETHDLGYDGWDVDVSRWKI